MRFRKGRQEDIPVVVVGLSKRQRIIRWSILLGLVVFAFVLIVRRWS